jgi:hypothetical protein
MLREDKNAWIERVELITEAEAAARNRADVATERVSVLSGEIALDEETVKRCEEGLEEASAQQPVDVLGFIDRLLSSKARQMQAQADPAVSTTHASSRADGKAPDASKRVSPRSGCWSVSRMRTSRMRTSSR